MSLFDDLPAAGAANKKGLFDDLPDLEQDGPLTRGFKRAINSGRTAYNLVTGDAETNAALTAERADYARKNPGSPEGNELMAAWEKGDGVMGGIKDVAGEVTKDWTEAPNIAAAVRATGKNLGAMGGGIIEQVPNMVAPMAGMLAGGAAGSLTGPVGTIGGAFAGATAGNTAMESAEQVDRALIQAGVNPNDKAAVKAYLETNGDTILGQAATKGAIIGAVDTATMGAGHLLLSAPGKAAAAKALGGMGVDLTDRAAVKAAMASDDFAARIATDVTYQASQKTLPSLARNTTVAALEPAGEFAGEYLGQGAATGDWDTKGAALEALSSIGQGAATFAGQKLYEAATSPLRGTDSAPPVVTPKEADQANADLGFAAGQYADLIPSEQKQLGYTPSVVQVPTQDGGTTTIDRNTGPLSDIAVDVVNNQIQTGMPLRAYATTMDAQAALDQRPDAERMRVVAHPRASGRYAVVPKDAGTLATIDAKEAARFTNESRLATVENEDGNAQPTVGTGSARPSDQSAGGGTSAGVVGGAAMPPTTGPAGRGESSDVVESARVADQALDELAPAPVQPIASMPASERIKAERQAVARAEAQARGAQLSDDEVASTNTSPTEAQQAAGNYQKGHTRIGSLDISIENPAGSTRSGKEGRTAWSVTMSDHYGYVKRTKGADSEQVDVYVKAGTPTDDTGPVFVVDQYNPKTKQFDEHKAFVGYRNALEVTRAYDAHFSDGSGPKRRKGITKMAQADFKSWAQNGDTSRAADAAQAEIAQSTGKESKTRSNGDLYQAAAEANQRRQERRQERRAPPTAQNDVAAVKQATGSDVTVVAEKDLPDADVVPKGQVSRQTAEFARHVAKLFGKRVVFVEGMAADGFYNQGDSIYLSTTGSIHHLRVLGHEMLHALRSQSKETYARMLDAVRDVVTETELTSQFRDYFGQDAAKKDWSDEQIGEWLTDAKNRDFLTEEWMADLSGNRWAESGFWEDVFTQVGNKYGSQQAKGIIAKLRMALVTAINKLKALVKGQAFDVDNRVTEQLDQIRAAIATGFADYAKAVKDGQVNQETGTVKFARGTADQTLPTRWPTSKALKPSINDDMITDLATLKQDPKQYAKAVAAILEEPGMHSADIVAGDVDAQAEHIVDRMQANLVWLFDQVPPAIRERSKLWYDGAREIADRWAAAYDITQSQAAGALAVLSPQKDWFMNVTMAERVLDILRDKMSHRWDDRMNSAAFSFLTKEAGREDPDGAKNMKAYEAVKGKTLAEVTKHHDLRQMGIWIRAYDEAYHDAKHAIVTPEGGFVEDKTTVKGEPTLRAWGDFTTLGKAASIYLDGSPENINKQLGGEHKVRNFYNNIYAPKDPRFTTIDTHAVAADLLRPLAGADKPVAENFGKTGGTNVTGLSGTYALHYEAYRRAAEARGVLPREMQSITWEAVRGLFTEGFKGKKENLRAVDAVWQQVDQGKLSVSDARNRILEMAGGIEQPDWWNEGNTEYKAVLRDKTYVPERKAFAGAKVTFEVAPDPRNAELKGRWEALSPEARHAISDKVAWKIAAKALASFNDDNMKGELHHQMGGWMADTNPSLSIWFNKRASGTKINQFARMLGTALRQESMMRTSPRPFKGMDGEKVKPAGAIIIDRKPGDSVEAIYAKVRTVIDPKGKPYVFGHTTDDGHMVIIHQDEAAISTVDLHHRIDEALGGDYDVSYSNIYVEFLNQGRNSYGFTGKKADPADASARTRANQLRAEADVLFDQLVGGAKLSTQRSDVARDERYGSGNARTGEEVRGYGTAAPGAVTVQGTHYSKQERANLDGRYYGTGMWGAEGPRVQAAADPRLKERVYFYVDKGTGVRPEDGVGSIAHTAQLNNVYDANADTWLQQKVGRELSGDAWLNAFEASVIDNGFDGYVTDFGAQRAAVLLGRHNVPVTRGKGGMSEAKQAVVTAKRTDLPMGKMTGAEWKKLEPRATDLEDDKLYYRDAVRYSPSRAQTETPEFKKWFGDSKVVDTEGKPLVVYHGTQGDVVAFDPARIGQNFRDSKGGYFFTGSASAASAYASRRGGAGGNVIPAYLSLQNPLTLETYLWSSGDTVQSALTDMGYSLSDLFDADPTGAIQYAKDSGADGIFWQNGSDVFAVVFNPTQIKSAIGNRGTFDPANPDIRFSPARAQTKTPEFERWFGDSKVVDENGDPLVVYHGTSGDFSVFDGGKSGSNFSGADSGFYFTNNANDVYIKDSSASAYAANAASTGGAANIIPAYVSLKNPLVVEKEMPGGPVKFADENRDGLRQQAKRGEHDGIILRDTGSELLSRDGLAETVFIAFRPEQIKSAIGNNGQFDPANPDIRYSPPRAQTETPEFKKWFGEWDHPKAFTSKFPADKTPPSQAMDWENNRPLVLFHATNGDFNAFETGRESVTSTTFGPVETRRHAIFTTPDVKFAESYLKKGGGQNVMPVYMDIKAPMDLRNNGAWDYVDELVKNGFENHRWPNRSDTEMWEMFDDETGEAFVAAAKKAGYDGAIMFEVNDDDKMVEVYVAFDPTQIKSAIGNNGQFDPANPDIRYSPPRFYSQLERAIEQAPDRVFGQAGQVKLWLAGNAGKLGVKQDEIQWSGINEWLDLQGKAKVSKDQVVQYLKQNGVKITEVEKNGQSFDPDNPTLPKGGELAVVPVEELKDDERAKPERWIGKADFAVVSDDDVLGVGETEEEAISDAYAGYPDLWEGDTKYGQYVLPGGGAYRELLLTLPTAKPLSTRFVVEGQGYGAKLVDTVKGFTITQGRYGQMVEEAMRRNAEDGGQQAPFKSAHWEEPNILAHVRFNDRTDAEGKRVLFIEELQSDWGQEGKKKGFDAPRKTKPMSDDEYNEFMTNMKEAAARYLDEKISDMDSARRVANSSPLQQVAAWAGMEAEYEETIARREEDRSERYRQRTVPSAPFVTDTKAWTGLAVKRMVAYAAENGYDKVAFVNGEQSAERYSLSKKVDLLAWRNAGGGIHRAVNIVLKDSDGQMTLSIDADGRVMSNAGGMDVAGKSIDEVLGKEVAAKIMEKDSGTLKGEGLNIGGEGMKAFYDKIVPQVVSDVLKKIGGGKLETLQVQTQRVAKIGRNWGLFDEDSGDISQRTRNPRIAMARAASPQLGFSITPAMRERVAEGLPLFSPLRKVWTDIAQDENVFQFPRSDKTDFKAVVAEIDPGIKVVEKGVFDDKMAKRFVVTMPDGKTADVIVGKDKMLWVNASQLQAGKSAGLRLYAAMLNYAHNAGLVLRGDPMGVSVMATFRRTENMLASALKFGTTKHMLPSDTQRNPAAYYDKPMNSKHILENFAPLEWEVGNDAKNLDSLLNVSYTNITNLVPEMKDVYYSLENRRFEHAGTDRPVTATEWNGLSELLASRLAGAARESGGLSAGVLAGEPGLSARGATLKRTAITGTVLREARSGDRGGVLDSLGAELRRDGVADRALYSLSRKVSDAVNSTITKLDAAVDGLSNLPNQFDYLRDRYLALGKIARVDEISTEVRKAFDGAAPADKQAVYDYLTTRGATTGRISDHKLRSIAKRIKDTINYTGDQLVARGLLDQEARDHYRDQYLPRMYLRHMLDDQSFKVIGMGKKPSDMGYLKHRKDIPQEIRDVVLGEIKDPSFLSVNAIGRAMRDVSLLDWMGKISQNNDWAFPEVFVPWRGKKVTAYWLRAEADRIENQSTHYTPANKTKADALIAQMRSTANQALGSMSAVDHKKYKQIPDTRRYGTLRGMWVRTEIYNDIMGASQIVNADPTWFEDWFGFGGKGTQLTQWWKFTKVAANPPGQIRNFISNMVMLQLSGIGLHRLPFALIEAARDISSNGKYWQVAKKYGVTESTFTAQELFRVKRDLIEMEARQGKVNSLRWLMAAGAKFMEGVSDLYQFSEALGKTIKIMEEMKAGKSEAEAAIEAQKWLFDYSLVPQSVRIARNAPVGMPFLTYQVKVLPRLLEVAAKHPWRFLPWAGLLYGMQAAVASLFGVDDDELKKLKKSLPEWLQDRGHTVFLPFRDADGRLQVADVGYFFPWTFYSQIGKHASEGKVKKALVDDIGGQFSAPILGAAAALMANYDTFTKQPIYKESDPVGYQAAAIANYAYDLMAPPFISSHGVVSPMGLVDTKYGGKLTQALAGTTNKFGDPRATEEQAMGAMLGFNFYGMDPEHTRVTNLKVMEYKIHEAEKGLKQRLMNQGLSPEQRAEAVSDYRSRMAELQQEMVEYAKESQVPEQLKVRK